MFRIKQKLIPVHIFHLYDKGQTITDNNENQIITRNHNIPTINRHSSTKYNKSFLCKSVTNWQSLPYCIKDITSYNSFKFNIKQHLHNI